MITEVSLDSVWPTVERRLRGQLRRAAQSPEIVDDVVQEVALRVLRSAPAFSSADDLLPWALVVARRLLVDAHRRSERLSVGTVPDATAANVEDEALSRVHLRAVARAIPLLPLADRRALLAAPADGDRRTQVRDAVRRHRARARLAKLVGGIGAAALWLSRRRWAPPVPAAALAVAVLVAVAVSVARSADPGEARAPRPAPRAGETLAAPAVSTAGAPPSRSVVAPMDEGSQPAPLVRAPHQRHRVGVPAERAVYVALRPRQPEEHTLCVRDLPVLGDRCLA